MDFSSSIAVPANKRNRSWRLLKKDDSFDSIQHPSALTLRPVSSLFVPPIMHEPIDSRWRELKIDGKNLKPLSSHAICFCDGYLYSYGGYEHNEQISSSFAKIKLADQSQEDLPPPKWQIIQTSFSPGPRRRHSLVTDGQNIYLFGGEGSSEPPTVDDSSNSFKQGYISDENERQYPNAEVFVYSISSNKWKLHLSPTTQQTPPNLASHSAVVVNNEMIVFGGFSKDIGMSSAIYSLNLQQMKWRKVEPDNQSPLIPARVNTAIVYHAPFLYVFGGENDLRNQNDLWRFPIASTNAQQSLPRVWQRMSTTGTIPRARSNHSAVVYNSILFVFGGSHSLMKEMNDVQALDLKTFAWSELCKDSNKLGLAKSRKPSHEQQKGSLSPLQRTSFLQSQSQQQKRSSTNIKGTTFTEQTLQIPKTVTIASNNNATTANRRSNTEELRNNHSEASLSQHSSTPISKPSEKSERVPEIPLSITKTLPTLRFNQAFPFNVVSAVASNTKRKVVKAFVLKPHQIRGRSLSQQNYKKASSLHLTEQKSMTIDRTLSPPQKSTEFPNNLPATNPSYFEESSRNGLSSSATLFSPSKNYLAIQRKKEQMSRKHKFLATIEPPDFGQSAADIIRQKGDNQSKMKNRSSEQVLANAHKIKSHIPMNIWQDSPMTVALKDSLFRVGQQSRFLTNTIHHNNTHQQQSQQYYQNNQVSIKITPVEQSTQKFQIIEPNQISKTKSAIIGKRPCPRDSHQSLLIAPHSLLVFGGDRHHMSFNDMYVFDLNGAQQELQKQHKQDGL